MTIEITLPAGVLFGMYDETRMSIDQLLAEGQMTPELLLQVCSHRMTDLDAQIRDVMGSLNARTAMARQASDRLAVLRAAMAALEPNFPTNGTAIDGAAVVVTVTFPGEAARTMTVNELATELTGRGFSNADALSIGTRTGMQNLIDGANDHLREVNSNNELLMIQLQQLMQTRTTLLSTTTNLMKTIDEGSDAIVANLR